MVKIKKIGVLSIGLYVALMAFVMLMLNMLFTTAIRGLAAVSPGTLNVLAANSILTQVILTIVVAFVTWVIIALIYNLIAARAGGIRIELSEARKR
jgi:hypothetical protein